MQTHRVAIMVDGGFFLKRMKWQFPNIDHKDPVAVAKTIHTHALRHCSQKTGGPELVRYDLYRIFFYDCPPFEKKMHYPISNKGIDFSKSKQAVFRRALHKELLKKRKVALRLGHLLDTTPWRLTANAQSALLKKKVTFDDLTDAHFEIDVKQKGVDMRLGLDVASLSYKKLVDQIVLIVGDSDFVPAAKQARREGIDIIIDPLGHNVHPDLFEHTDGIRTPKVVKREDSDQLMKDSIMGLLGQLGNMMTALNTDVEQMTETQKVLPNSIEPHTSDDFQVELEE